MIKVLQCGIEPGTSCITHHMFIAHQKIKLVQSWWAVKHTTNGLLFDTYVSNKPPHGMPSVMAFYYELAT